MSTHNLENKAMLLRLSVKSWNANRTDRKATEAVHREYGAARGSGAYNKHLVSKIHLQPVAQAVTALRTWHDAQTLPWDTGLRIIPNRNFLAYTEGFQARKSRWQEAVADFCAGYPAFVQQAERELNGLFNPAEYPAPAHIAGFYRLDLDRLPVPAVQDWRLEGFSAPDMDAIKAEAHRSIQATLAEAQAAAWERMAEKVAHLCTKLKIPPGSKSPEGETGNFHQSYVDGLADLLDTLPRLNLFEDPALDAVVAECKAQLATMDAEAIREDTAARAEKARAADELLRKMAGYTGMAA